MPNQKWRLLLRSWNWSHGSAKGSTILLLLILLFEAVEEMRQNILGDCSSENICSLMKSVQFVGLLVCLQYAHDCILWIVLISLVKLSVFLLDSWWWWWWWWWYNLMGSFSGSPLYWAPNPKVEQVQSSIIQMKGKESKASLLCGLKFSSEAQNMLA